MKLNIIHWYLILSFILKISVYLFSNYKLSAVINWSFSDNYLLYIWQSLFFPSSYSLASLKFSNLNFSYSDFTYSIYFFIWFSFSTITCSLFSRSILFTLRSCSIKANALDLRVLLAILVSTSLSYSSRLQIFSWSSFSFWMCYLIVLLSFLFSSMTSYWYY